MNSDLSKIIDLLNSGSFAKAELEVRRLYKDNPYSFDLNKILGLSCLGQKKYSAALKCFERCYEKNHNDFETILNLGFLFTKIQFYQQSIEFCNKAIDINSEHPSSYQNLADTYFYLNLYDDAEKNALKAIELRGGFDSRLFFDNADELVGLYGDILLAQKKNDEFVSYATKVLAQTYHQNTMIKLLRLDKKYISDKYLDVVQQVLNKGEGLSNKVSKHVYLSGAHFILAEYYNKIDQNKSEEHYIEGNKLISDAQRQSLFNRQKITKLAYEYFSQFNFDEVKKNIDPNKGAGIIFVMGMPRSGTTLTESILSTADDIVAGGEKSFFSIQLHQISKDIFNPEHNLDINFFNELGDRYLENIKLHRQGKTFFIDKLPENFFFYKFIKLSLPGAKFINCYRDPWDNAISLFKQNYSITVFFASSFFGIALEYANYEFLINFWKKLDGSENFFDVSYETLVSKDQNFLKKLWGFCGLQGEYTEEKRKKHVGYTASFQQVTKEIYKTSIKKDDFAGSKDQFYKDLFSQREYWEKIIKYQ